MPWRTTPSVIGCNTRALHRAKRPASKESGGGLFLYQGRACRLVGFMLVLVKRRWQIKGVLFVLRIDGLRRQQRHFHPLQQLKHPFNLERRWATGEFTFLLRFLMAMRVMALSCTNAFT